MEWTSHAGGLVKEKVGVLLGLFLLLLPACTTRTTPVAPATTSAAPSPQAPPAPRANGAETRPPPDRPIPVSSQAPRPTATLSPVPLAEPGPWLLYTDRNEEAPHLQVVLSALDGSDRRSGALPYDRWNPGRIHAAPRGGRLALQWEEAGFEYELWIVQLPEVYITKIPLVSPGLREEMVEVWNDYRGEHEIVRESLSPVSAILNDPYQAPHFVWSPDGRYLAFSAALDGPSTDIHVYDAESQTVRRLTDEPGQARHFAWSPDSEWLVYGTFTECQVASCAPDEIRAVSLVSGEQHRLYESSERVLAEVMLGWTSARTFVTKNTFYQAASHDRAPSENLRGSDLETGTWRYLYDGPFADASLDPTNQILIIEPDDCDACAEGTRKIVRLRVGESNAEVLFTDSRGLGDWIPELQQFSAFDADENLFTFTSTGEVKLRLSGWPWVLPSPDGQWVVVYDENETTLRDAEGRVIRGWNEATSEVLWLPDSSGFYRAVAISSSASVLYLHLERNGLEGQVLDSDIPYYPWLIIINP